VLELYGQQVKESMSPFSGFTQIPDGVRPFAVHDGNLITGQQQYSGAAAAKLAVTALGR